MRAMNRMPVGLLLLLLANVGHAHCFEQAGARYGVSPVLLSAISRVESNGNPLARNVNRDGSEDLGHMQINSRWLRVLASYGIDRKALLDPCINAHVGAWILAQSILAHGYRWEAIGAYNARSRSKRAIYAHRVASALKARRY
jgi:soluble lytic murein transglycosylase-like protein